jgi:hypothetical protein
MRCVWPSHITDRRAPYDPTPSARTHTYVAVAPSVTADASMTDFNIVADVQFPSGVVVEFDRTPHNVATRLSAVPSAPSPGRQPLRILPFRRRSYRRRTDLLPIDDF